MTAPAEPKPTITFGKFQNIDMRIARVTAAPLATGTRAASRWLTLDLGPLGERHSVAQLALVDEHELVGRHVVACVNLAPRQIGDYLSEALVLGAPHPHSPAGEAQALPLYVSDLTAPGDCVF